MGHKLSRGKNKSSDRDEKGKEAGDDLQSAGVAIGNIVMLNSFPQQMRRY